MTDRTSEPPLLDVAWLSTLRERIASGSGLLLCLDFDGTLAPIVENPDEAVMTDASRRHLQRLAAEDDVVVVIVSGRSLDDLRARTGLDEVIHAGNHGLECEPGSDLADAAPELDTGGVESAVERLGTGLDGIPGCRVEDKTLTATVHYRQTPDEHVESVLERVRSVVDSTPNLRQSSGKEIVELRPDESWGKDRVVTALREQYPDHVPVFVGDDVTDEDGFEAVAPDGFGVVVGDRSDTAASVRVADPGGVSLLLGWLVQTIAESRTSTE